jgi:hypothetical protein
MSGGMTVGRRYRADGAGEVVFAAVAFHSTAIEKDGKYREGRIGYSIGLFGLEGRAKYMRELV